jgi:uncharacterized protein YqeY
MLNLSQIEQDLTAALKSRDALSVDVLRGLKTRIQNVKIAKASALGGKDLPEEDVLALVRSEVKRRKEAAEAFRTGNRPELADKELKEAEILSRYLPAQMSEQQVSELADKVIAENGFAAKDLGQAMGKLKALAGKQADGAVMAKVLKEKLK